MQAGMGALQHGAGGAATAGEAIPGELLGATSGDGELGGGAGGGAGGGGLGATTTDRDARAASRLRPPVLNPHRRIPLHPRQPTHRRRRPIPRRDGGMPMMPPGAMQGAGGAGSDAKPDTKRIVAPAVKNGAPVQGRITTPAANPEVTKRVDGKPIASRRIFFRPEAR